MVPQYAACRGLDDGENPLARHHTLYQYDPNGSRVNVSISPAVFSAPRGIAFYISDDVPFSTSHLQGPSLQSLPGDPGRRRRRAVHCHRPPLSNLMHESNCEKYCVFRQSADWYGLAALSVLEVAPVPALVSVPNSNPVLAGLSQLRREFVPVLQLRALASAPSAQQGGEQKLLVVDGTEGPWGLLVDHVAGLEPLEVSPGHDTPAADDWAAAIVGSAATNGRLIRILDARRVYCLAEATLQQHWESDTQTCEMSR